MNGSSLAFSVNLNELCKKTDGNYIEIGCYDGVNLALLSEAFPDKKIYGLDSFISDGWVGGITVGIELTAQESTLYSNIKDRSNIVFFKQSSKDFIAANPDYALMNITSIFVDGSHHLEDIKVDIDLVLKCIGSNKNRSGVVLFHDLHIPDVNAAIEYFFAICSEKNITVITESGIADRDAGSFKITFEDRS